MWSSTGKSLHRSFARPLRITAGLPRRVASAALTALFLASVSCAGSDSSLVAPNDEEAATIGSSATAAFCVVVGGVLNQSEQQLVARLETEFQREVTVVRDVNLASTELSDFALFVMSKTVLSTTVGTHLKNVSAPVVFWEDNQQMLSMMATIDNDGSSGTGWHTGSSTIHVEAGAPPEFRAGLSGTINFYDRVGEVTFSPWERDLPASAIRIARLRAGDGRVPIYAYEEGTVLADGTNAAGRRVYFGLYDNTFRFLTPNGLRLFDAAVTWALGRTGPVRAAVPAPGEG